MATLYEFQTSLRYYNNLRDNLNQVVRYLNNCIDDLQPATKNFLTVYNVDEFSKGNNVLLKDLDSLVEKRNTIKNTVIPAVNFEISKLKKQIEEEYLKLT